MSRRSKLLNAGLRGERVRASKQHDGSVFKNPSGLGPGLQGNPLPILGEYFFGGAQRLPPKPLAVERPHEAWARKVSSGLRVTWRGPDVFIRCLPRWMSCLSSTRCCCRTITTITSAAPP